MRAGFTLFEVGVSLWIMVIAVATVLMVLPTGIQLQQTARYQFLAASKALSFAANMSSRTQLARSQAWNEGNSYVDGVHVNLGFRMPDLHQVANQHYDGMGVVMPQELARRLDSPGDEIARILDEGGDIFYVPAFTSNMLFAESGSDALVGREQATNMRRLIFAFRGHAQQNALISHPQTAWPYINPQPVRGAFWERNLWGLAGLTRPSGDDYTLTSAEIVKLSPPLPPLPLPGPWPTDADIAGYHAGLTDIKFPGACLAIRNHAFASLLRATTSGDPGHIAQARIDHEWMMRFLMWARRELPDDCRIPRLPWNQVMTDIPLLQYDLFAPAVLSDPGTYPARRADPDAARWRAYPLLSERLMRFTRSWAYANTPAIPDTTSGRFNLTAPFAAAERCRQMVVWMVDWQSYEDFESLPPAPIDSGRMPYRPVTATTSGRLQNNFSRKYPEWVLFFTDTTRTDVFGPMTRAKAKIFIGDSNISPTGSVPQNTPMRALGRYGVDRNHNGVFDVGPVRTSVRLRALTVARFNLYDPRGHVILR